MRALDPPTSHICPIVASVIGESCENGSGWLQEFSNFPSLLLVRFFCSFPLCLLHLRHLFLPLYSHDRHPGCTECRETVHQSLNPRDFTLEVTHFHSPPQAMVTHLLDNFKSSLTSLPFPLRLPSSLPFIYPTLYVRVSKTSLKNL